MSAYESTGGPITERPRAARRNRASGGGDLTGWVGMAGIALFLVMGGAPLRGGVGSLDPWFYTGYVNNYGWMLEHFGRTYYSTRVAAIWPQEWLYTVFGDGAYAITRWLLLMAAGGSLALFLRQHGRPLLAYPAGIALMVFAPFLVEASTDYTPVFALAFALVALPLLGRGKVWSICLGGAAVSLALNSYEGSLHTTVPIVAAFLIGAILHRVSPRVLLVRASWFGVGLAGTQVLLSSIMVIRYGWERSNWFFQEASISIADRMMGGLAADWAVPWDNPYTQMTTSVIVIAAWVTILMVGAWTRRSGERIVLTSIACGLAITIGLVLVSHLILHSGMVGLSYGVVWAVLPAFIGTWLALTITAEGSSSRWIGCGALVGALMLGFLFGGLLAPEPAVRGVWWAAAATAMGLAAYSGFAQFAQRRGLAQAISALLAAGVVIPLAPMTTSSNTGYALASNALRGSDARADGLHETARAFHSYVTRTVPPGVPFRVFYKGSLNLTSVQSTVLWGFTCLGCVGPNPFPEYTTLIQTAIRTGGVQAVVLVAETRGSVARAAQAAVRSGDFQERLPITRLGSAAYPIWATTLRADSDLPIR